MESNKLMVDMKIVSELVVQKIIENSKKYMYQVFAACISSDDN